ncbi:MAG TPA: serine/threonine-protein kinase, partial [Kofleriaceae bacterium]
MTEPAREGPSTVDDVDLPLRFEARRVLGRGGMGIVIEVLDRDLGREVAVKILAADKRDPTHRARFRREANAAAVLRHPNIVTVYDVDPERDLIVMELVRGESLRARLRRVGKLDVDETRRIATALLDALAAAHDAQIIHRDVKPANILFDDNGTVKLVDFGIASFGDRDLTATGKQVGTPAYMAPEQLRGRVADVRADIYAVGATLFEMTTGAKLHDSDHTPDEVNAAVLEATHDSSLAAAITRAVAPRPEDRFASARELAEALTAARPSAVVGQPAPRRMRRRWWLVVAALVMVVAGTGVTIWAVRDRGSRAIAPSRDGRTELATVAILPFADRT